MRVDERGFEEAIEATLLADGYLKSVPSHFDPVLGLDTAELFAFIGVTQGKAWDRILGRYGNDPDAAQRGFARRLAAELDSRGTVDVLRHGVVDLGVTVQLAFFKPAHGLTPELQQLYAANRVSVTRQLAFDSKSHKTLDMVLLVNGIPTATAELKNPLTGQGVEEAITQYRTDRDPANVTLARRAVVHFAVDPDRVAMTTRLAGQATQFLPFNLGHDGGAGNPPNPHGHRTSYLWERVWSRDAWMDILARFVHGERPAKGTATKGTGTFIFPRYHQWDAVLALVADAREHGPGRSYLVQHSAGSGKSNTIAWIAHRLSSLHDETDHKVFDKVVVITDRLVLDRQLQDTIYQFEHARGVVAKIDKNSAQLAEALAGEQARIIVTTLQKFPFVLDKIGQLPARRYAVMVDEAHSSQTGEAAKDLRMALGATEEQELTAAEAEDAGFIAQAIDPVEEALAKAVGRPGSPGQHELLRLHRHPQGPDPGNVRHPQPRYGQVRAVPPVLDATGHRGRLHPRRTGQLHDLQDLLADREGSHRRPRVPGPQGPPGHRSVRLAAPDQPGTEGRDHCRALPSPHSPQDRWPGQGHGRHLVPFTRRALQAGNRRLSRPGRLHGHCRPGGLLRAGHRRQAAQLHRDSR